MSSSSLVSIILPVFNGEETLHRTVDSLLSQSYSHFELLVCIDGSTDGSEAVLRSFNDHRISIFKNNINLGLASTLNRLMNLVSSDSVYVAMAEQDDWYYPERIEKQVRFLNSENEVGLVSGLAEHWNGIDEEVSLFPGLLKRNDQYPAEYTEFLKLNYRYQIKVVNTCMMFRKSVYVDNGLYFSSHYPNVSVDWAFILRFSRFSVIKGIHEVLVRMDRRGSRSSVTMNKKKQFAAAHELLRCFLYECEDLKKNDYRFAKVTQLLLEFGSYSFLLCWRPLLKAMMYRPFDQRIYASLGRRIKKRIFHS